MVRKKIAIIGGGAAGLMAAYVLSQRYEVHLYEKGKTLGRKFLVAGNGGFNLTNSATGEELYGKCTPNPTLLKALAGFNSNNTRHWLAELGIPTFVGSSGRVFPEKGIKPIQVLQQIKDKLIQQGVQFHYQHEFIVFDREAKPVLKHLQNSFSPTADHYIFALGGASWPVTGSAGDWLNAFEDLGVKTHPFQASNCGVTVDWPDEFRANYAGTPLKNIEIEIAGFKNKGEALITDYGLEGNAIYPVVPKVREALNAQKEAFLNLDLKPQNTQEQLLEKVKGRNVQTKNYGHIFNLSKAQLALIKAFTSKDNYINPELFVQQLKSLAIPVFALRPIEEAISTVGGIDLKEINHDFTLIAHPNISVIGEMLNWDAPTGGFLLQGCFSMGYAAAKAISESSETSPQ